MKKKATLAVVGILLVVAITLLWFARDKNNEATTPVAAKMPANAQQSKAMLTQALAQSRDAANRFKTGLENIPKSLRDTQVDGELTVDAAGNLVINHAVRQTFDYFLSAIGEEDLTTIVARMRAYIRAKLPAKAAAQAEQLLESYLSYREALGHIAQVQGDPAQNLAQVRQQKQQIQSLRSQYFQRNVIDAFFGDEDAYDNYTMARIEVMQDKNLSATEKARRSAELLETLPAQLKESVKVINQYQELTSLTDDWKSRNGSAEELHQIREQLVGPEATQRLEGLDKERAEWDGRMKTYLQQRDDILKNQALSEDDRQRQIAGLRQQNFNAQELVRAEALEHMHDQGVHP